MASILGAVRDELAILGASGWRAQTALTLAATLDDEPNASMARELRSLMTELGSSAKAVAAKGDIGDDLAAGRAARIAAAAGS